MKDWRRELRYDPIPALSRSKSEPLLYFVKRDLMGLGNLEVERIWDTKEVAEILRRQQENGVWKYAGARTHARSMDSYDQLETYRILGRLIEKHALDRTHPAIQKGAEHMFARQSREGDLLRLAGNQYTPYYTGAIMELLIKAGYRDDSRIAKGFQWLLDMRQYDGGWAFPLRTVGMKLSAETFQAPTVGPNRRTPFSHLVTGMVLRAFAAHPIYRDSNGAQTAGRLLASRFFQPDKYPDRRAATFWTRFSFPFWFTDLLTSMDSLSNLHFTIEGAQIRKALSWFVQRQRRDGLWSLPLRTMAGEPEADRWLTLAVSRVFQRFYR